VAVHVDLDEDEEEGGAGGRGGAGGAGGAGAERLPAVSLRDSSVEGRVWGPPGVTARALGPDKPLEKNVKVWSWSHYQSSARPLSRRASVRDDR
jgi:hypothetical protein